MSHRFRRLVFAAVSLAAVPAIAAPGDYFGLHFVDADTGRGVPLVTVELTSEQRLVSDSNGYVAFDEPGLMDTRVYFGVTSYGYEAKEVGFGYRGVIAQTTPGKIVDVPLRRTQIAQRLYRLTGQGIYRDTVLLGLKPPIDHPLLNGRVMGQDTVETAIYKGKMVWCWGDTDRPDFPLGLFHTPAATSPLPKDIDLDRGINYTYFTGKDGFCRATIKLKKDVGSPIWIDGLMVVPDATGEQKLLGRYSATRDLKEYQRGLLLFDDATQTFRELNQVPLDAPACPGNHPTRATVNGQEFYYFGGPYPTLRCRADFDHATDVSTYEGLTCLKPASADVNRDAAGKLVWTWQVGVRPVGPREAAKLGIKADETPYQMRDVATGKPVHAVNGSVAWNAWAKRWVMVFGQQGGKSNLGEIWVAGASAIEGPWTDAVKVATHAAHDNNNDFYNPMMNAEFAQQDGRIVYFQGTLVTTFSGNPYPTPRYNYNQILYRLDLADPRVKLPDPPPPLIGDARPSPLGP